MTDKHEVVDKSDHPLGVQKWCLTHSMPYSSCLPMDEPCRYLDRGLVTLPQLIAELKAESDRPDSKWGRQTHTLADWWLILSEEVGEAAKEACDLHFGSVNLSSGRGPPVPVRIFGESPR